MPSPGPADPSESSATLDAEERRRAVFCATALAVLGAGSLLGVASFAYLVNHHPLLLIALSPLGRHLILVAPIVDPVAFVVVAVARRMLFYLASFHLGRALGPTGLPWLEARAARFAGFVRFLERLFQRAAHAVVLLMTGPTVSALAGISGMRTGVFLALALPGLTARMLVVVYLGHWLREPIEALLAVIDAYWRPITVVLVIGIVLHRWWRRAAALRTRPRPAGDQRERSSISSTL